MNECDKYDMVHPEATAEGAPGFALDIVCDMYEDPLSQILDKYTNVPIMLQEVTEWNVIRVIPVDECCLSKLMRKVLEAEVATGGEADFKEVIDEFLQKPENVAGVFDESSAGNHGRLVNSGVRLYHVRRYLYRIWGV